MQTEIVNKRHERFLREFMDILIMARMRKTEIKGYDIITYFHQKFDLLEAQAQFILFCTQWNETD